VRLVSRQVKEILLQVAQKKVSQDFFVLGDCPMAVLVFFLGTAGAGSVAPYFPPICWLVRFGRAFVGGKPRSRVT